MWHVPSAKLIIGSLNYEDTLYEGLLYALLLFEFIHAPLIIQGGDQQIATKRREP